MQKPGLEVGDADVPKGPGRYTLLYERDEDTVQHRELYSASFCFVAVLGLRGCVASPLVAVNGGCSRVVVLQLLIVAASLVAAHCLLIT